MKFKLDQTKYESHLKNHKEHTMESIVKEVGYYKSFDNTPIYYESRGQGPTLVLIYGIACLMNHWHHQIEFFSKNYRVITLDLRGHHKSSEISENKNLTIPSMARDIIGLLDHLKISKAHFAGHSFGAPVILEAYKLAPEKFQSLVFINGFAQNPIKDMFGLNIVEPFFHFIKSEYERAPDLWGALWRTLVYNPLSMRLAAIAGGFNIKLTHFKDIEVYAKGVAQMDLNIFLPLFESLMKFDGQDILPTITCPSLIISGENDKVTPKKFQYDLHDQIKGSEFWVVPYGSHCTQLDFPEYVNLKMSEFLEKNLI